MVEAKVVKRGRKEIEKKNTVLGQLRIEYVAIDAITPNDYNPNRQSEHDYELLIRSMTEDGFTQPVIAHQETKVIVDGEHRWRAARDLGFTEIPVVFVDMTPEQARISTLRHNRARGSEDIQLTAQVLRDLEQLGALDWAQDSLLLDDVEISRLLEDIPAPDALGADEYGQAWVPDMMGDWAKDEVNVDAQEINYMGGKIYTGMTPVAADRVRAREKAIAEAKNEEEMVIARKEADFFRLALMYYGNEAVVIKKALGSTPAPKLLEMCVAELRTRGEEVPDLT